MFGQQNVSGAPLAVERSRFEIRGEASLSNVAVPVGTDRPNSELVEIIFRKSDTQSLQIDCSCVEPGRRLLCIALGQARLKITAGKNACLEATLAPGSIASGLSSHRLLFEFRDRCNLICLNVSDEYSRRVRQRLTGLTAPDEHWVIPRDPLVEQLAKTTVDANEEGNEPFVRVAAETMLMRIIALRSSRRTCNSLPRWRLVRVRTYVSQNLAAKIRLSELARVAGLSEMHFAAQFRAATGFTPHEYVLFERTERAKQMLLGEDSSLAGVALDLGFDTQSHFTSVFKRYTGETPGAWRRKHGSTEGGTGMPIDAGLQ
jgi:AraC family transcriptional regulator